MHVHRRRRLGAIRSAGLQAGHGAAEGTASTPRIWSSSFGDNFGPQLPLLAEGLSHYNIGQRPYDMGYQTIKALDDLTKGKTLKPMIITGTEICTPENATTTCGKVGN